MNKNMLIKSRYSVSAPKIDFFAATSAASPAKYIDLMRCVSQAVSPASASNRGRGYVKKSGAAEVATTASRGNKRRRVQDLDADKAAAASGSASGHGDAQSIAAAAEATASGSKRGQTQTERTGPYGCTRHEEAAAAATAAAPTTTPKPSGDKK